ncbi:hypothetical protein DDT56_17585 [Brenneria corticis]|uniref:Uncharacterized protein n=1 Tax=Brenneria corticis TaxID=2173106 RepID=A0A2U1TSU5_9GAMM|nr:hypothetical protein DDT56_17585 [Brenneria sp. CFCC 11842]
MMFSAIVIFYTSEDPGCVIGSIKAFPVGIKEKHGVDGTPLLSSIQTLYVLAVIFSKNIERYHIPEQRQVCAYI